MKIIFNIFTLLIGLGILTIWLQATVILLIFLLAGFFLLSIVSIFHKGSSKQSKQIISIAKYWMNIPIQILETYDME